MEHYKNLNLENLTGYDNEGNLHVEQWKDIEGYDGLYQISSFGRIKSYHISETFGCIRKGWVCKGYCYIRLHNNNIQKTFRIHRIVAISFTPNPENKPEVNHRDLVGTHNCVWNLEWNTRRENETHYYITKKYSSKHIGVYWSEEKLKWVATVSHKGKSIYLGYYTKETEASNVYQKAIKEINDNTFIAPKREYSSKYKGVRWDKRTGKWMAQITHNKKQYNLGRFISEEIAHIAYQNKLKEINSNDINL
jgi:hypothetical protein